MNDLSPKEVVLAFFEQVRTGKNVQAAYELLAETHLAHQVVSGCEYAITRTPADYAAHIAEMHATYGDFRLTVEELLAEGDKVYVRWQQQGVHSGQLFDIAPTQRPLSERASAVYRVAQGKIVEYWIQIETDGVRRQLESF
ncbi:MAG: polyketide cyclase [Anaerolineaceae bacterium]|nr:polyketide cyclase [Anaerolineaceae bacterium]